MLVVADTSALITLAACNGLGWLDTLFTKVLVPQAVFQEATILGKPQAARLRKYLEGNVVKINLQDFVINTQGLGKGELEAMALYKHQHADKLLIDDLHARKAAIHNNIQVIGSIGVLVLAKKSNLILAIKPHLQIIRQSDVHLGLELVNKALQIAGE